MLAELTQAAARGLSVSTSPAHRGHEVIIESRSHATSLSQLDVAEIQLAFLAFRDRIRHWREVPRIAYVTAFKNAGARAGASLRHTHSQLIATDRIPSAVAGMIDRMIRHRASSGCCLHMRPGSGELKAQTTLSGVTSRWSPIARSPAIFRCWFVSPPWITKPCYEDLDDMTIESAARLVRRVVCLVGKDPSRNGLQFLPSHQAAGSERPAGFVPLVD